MNREDHGVKIKIKPPLTMRATKPAVNLMLSTQANKIPRIRNATTLESGATV